MAPLKHEIKFQTHPLRCLTGTFQIALPQPVGESGDREARRVKQEDFPV